MIPIMDIKNLNVTFGTPDGAVNAVNDLSLSIGEGDAVAIVGESGSGKSQTFLACLGLLASNGRADGQVLYRGQDILNRPEKELNRIRGDRITMVFQDPMTSLTPHMRIGDQLAEALVYHRDVGMADAKKRVIEMLERVRISEAAKRARMYPHQLSGGMRQRVMIALSLMTSPDLIIADEPTTALDVTVQADILNLLAELRRQTGVAIILITHDLGTVADLCERAAIMYGGRIVEEGSISDLYHRPLHPYTEALWLAAPRHDTDRMGRLKTIPGQPPNLMDLPAGCAFEPRCPYAKERCCYDRPVLRQAAPGRRRACHLDSLEAA